MLYYLLFWTLLGFIIHFYIIFGTNLLTGGPAQNCCFFAYFRVSKKRNIKRSPNGMKPSGSIFLEQMQTWSLGVDIKQQTRQPQGCPVCPPGVGAPPPSWAPRVSTDLLLPPIYTPVPWKHQKQPQKPNSTAATFCICEIPSWSLGRHSTGGGIDHGGPLHHIQDLSDELWVVYHRPSGP